jgi:hypothetical protein
MHMLQLLDVKHLLQFTGHWTQMFSSSMKKYPAKQSLQVRKWVPRSLVQIAHPAGEVEVLLAPLQL